MCAHAYEVYGWSSFANKGPMYGQATTSLNLTYQVRNTWTTDISTIYQSNGTKYYQLKRAAEDRKDGMDS